MAKSASLLWDNRFTAALLISMFLETSWNIYMPGAHRMKLAETRANRLRRTERNGHGRAVAGIMTLWLRVPACSLFAINSSSVLSQYPPFLPSAAFIPPHKQGQPNRGAAWHPSQRRFWANPAHLLETHILTHSDAAWKFHTNTLGQKLKWGNYQVSTNFDKCREFRAPLSLNALTDKHTQKIENAQGLCKTEQLEKKHTRKST